MKPKVLIIGGTGLVGRSIRDSLIQTYQVVITAGHHEAEGGYQLQAEDRDRLLEILEKENPQIVISSIKGAFQPQYAFHTVLSDWLVGKSSKRLLFISTANVFDGDLSQPCTEQTQPNPESEYGKYKRDCETMLMEKLQEQLIIFRLGTVWAPQCPRIQELREHSASEEPLKTYPNDYVNITLASQIGAYAEYVLKHDLRGIFHVATKDMVDYFEFQKLVCDQLEIKLPQFVSEDIQEKVFQAVLPARTEIPDTLQLTVSQVLAALKSS
ncbi:MAG: sugar nucleotide-binding protein [Lachnospiraceae bacterium]|nr:sugar nucleotide-binding protein [Lachnospiraceae bacterium]